MSLAPSPSPSITLASPSATAELPTSSGLAHQLHGRIRIGQPWGIISTLVLGIGSFGLVPLIVWPRRFYDYATEESRQLSALARWIAALPDCPAEAGAELESAAQAALPSPAVPTLISILAFASILSFYLIAGLVHPMGLGVLIRCTYGFSHYTSHALETDLHLFWIEGLAVGFAIQAIGIAFHSATTRRYVQAFDGVMAIAKLPPIRCRVLHSASYLPGWLLLAAGCCIYQAWWGPLMVATALMQRRYCRLTAQHYRLELSKRVRDIEAAGGRLTVSQISATRCHNALCLARLPSTARFCHRCGLERRQA